MTVPVAPADVATPALLRAARRTYVRAVNARLAQIGYTDLPRNGPFILGGMATPGGSATDVIDALGVSRQAASQLIDTLVSRGYLHRDTDQADRRRMVLRLTERGRAAGMAVRAGVADIDGTLARVITPAEMAGLRAGLIALAGIRARKR
ncbi:MAG: MarR family winged helix-turn-helix transcriptional regulator [Streptosporangiaceae bacterium]